MHRVFDPVDAEVGSQSARIKSLGDLRIVGAAELTELVNCVFVAIYYEINIYFYICFYCIYNEFLLFLCIFMVFIWFFYYLLLFCFITALLIL